MKRKLILFCAIALILSMGLCGCEYDKDGDGGYVPRDEYVLPTSGNAEKGTVPYVVAKLIEAGQVVRDYNQLPSAAIQAEEAYCIRTNGVNVEIYRFAEDSPMFVKIKELNAYPIMNQEGELLGTNRAIIRDQFVMMIPTNTNSNAMDVTELNEKLVKRFLEIKL
ncbi:MAG: hypothetical protein IJN42_04765 [Clostridia bacterium]|nr:hypothetical protein [Clostridia bacterium]